MYLFSISQKRKLRLIAFRIVTVTTTPTVYVRHCTKHFVYTNALKLHHAPGDFVSLLCRWGNWGSERSGLHQTQSCLIPKPMSSISTQYCLLVNQRIHLLTNNLHWCSVFHFPNTLCLSVLLSSTLMLFGRWNRYSFLLTSFDISGWYLDLGSYFLLWTVLYKVCRTYDALNSTAK